MAVVVRRVRVRDLRERDQRRRECDNMKMKERERKKSENENFSRVGFFALFLNFLCFGLVSTDYELWNSKLNRKPENLSLTDPQSTRFSSRVRLLVFGSNGLTG